jgi:hypothetical protein
MRLGIIGLKGHVRTVLSGARLLGDVEVVAISEDDPKRLAATLKKDPSLQKGVRAVGAFGGAHDAGCVLRNDRRPVRCALRGNHFQAEVNVAIT